MRQELHRLWGDRTSQSAQLIRYADDTAVLRMGRRKRTRPSGGSESSVSRLKLTLHPTKTQKVYVGDGRQASTFQMFTVARWNPRTIAGKYYLQRWPGRRAM
jgi:hypothetical protein